MNELLIMLAATPKYEPFEFFETRKSSGRTGQRSERRAVVLVGDTHVEVAVDADALDADVVVLQRLGLDRCLVGQVGGHRVHRIDDDRLLGLKSLLTLLEIGDALGHLFTQLLGLSLDVRKLIGVGRRCESQNGCC